MAAPIGPVRICETAGCNGEAKLQCPTCIKLSIQGSFFCSQASQCVNYFVVKFVGLDFRAVTMPRNESRVVTNQMSNVLTLTVTIVVTFRL